MDAVATTTATAAMAMATLCMIATHLLLFLFFPYYKTRTTMYPSLDWGLPLPLPLLLPLPFFTVWNVQLVPRVYNNKTPPPPPPPLPVESKRKTITHTDGFEYFFVFLLLLLLHGSSGRQDTNKALYSLSDRRENSFFSLLFMPRHYHTHTRGRGRKRTDVYFIIPPWCSPLGRGELMGERKKKKGIINYWTCSFILKKEEGKKQ